MAEFAALPLFTDAYLADTRHLTTLQHGAYLLMLMTAWRSSDCSLPNDDVYLARICGMDKRTWAANKSTLLSFWRIGDDAKIRQGRLEDERNYVEQKRNKNSEAGKASALKRKNRDSTGVQPNANQSATPSPSPSPSPKVKDKSLTYPDGIPLPSNLDLFIQFRKEKKSPITQTQIELFLKKLMRLAKESNCTTERILEQSIECGWIGIFNLKENQNGTHKQTTGEIYGKSERNASKNDRIRNSLKQGAGKIEYSAEGSFDSNASGAILPLLEHIREGA